MADQDHEDVTAVCPECKAENTVAEENAMVVDIAITDFYRTPDGHIRIGSYEAYDTGQSEIEPTGDYRCMACGVAFTGLKRFFPGQKVLP